MEILVGVDGSDAAQRALRRAVLEAESAVAEVHVVHAWTTPIWIGGIPGLGYNVLASPEDSRSWAQGLLDKQLVGLLSAGKPSVVVRAEVIEGSAKHVLAELASTADLLVVGGHGEGGLKAVLLGSAAWYLLHHCPCPVMVVPAGGPEPTAPRRVVVGADGSEHSRAALRWGLDAARRHRCPLVVVHGWTLSDARTTAGAPPVRLPAPTEEYHDQAQAWLDEEIEQTLPERAGADVTGQVLRGSPAWELVSQSGPEDLLVLGARGHGGFPALLLGSVASQCAQHTRGPLVVVRRS